jgi:hypothetical protein
MAVTQQVRMPSGRSSRDPFAALLGGLKIAQGIYGIKTAQEQSDLRKLQAERDERRLKMAEEEAGRKQAMGEKQLALKEKQFGATQEANRLQKEERQQFKLGEEMRKLTRDKKTKDLISDHNAAVQVKDLVGLKNPIADAIAKRNLFRISGDVGAIRENDLRELGADPSLKERAQLAMDTLLKGNPITDNARLDIVEASNVLQQIKKKELDNWTSQQARIIAGQFRGVDQEDVLEGLDLEKELLQVAPETELVLDRIRQTASGQVAPPDLLSQTPSAPVQQAPGFAPPSQAVTFGGRTIQPGPRRGPVINASIVPGQAPVVFGGRTVTPGPATPTKSFLQNYLSGDLD